MSTDIRPAASGRDGVAAAAERAVDFLSTAQAADGEFPSFLHQTPTLGAPGVTDPSPFVTTFVLYTLSLGEDPRAPAMVERGAAFLLRCQEPPGVWRYWISGGTRQSPADLDDTCCASWVLQWLGTPGFEPRNEALILGTRGANGLFPTWLREGANDYDSVVNANVLLYLGERPETAAACEILNQSILRGMEERTYYYYLDPLALYYMVSRARAHGVLGLERCRAAVVEKTLARQLPDGSFGADMLTGLALCTLCNLGLAGSDAVVRGVAHLLRAQRSDGAWADHIFYAGPEPPTPHFIWWSSPSLATGLCLEALYKSDPGD